MKNTPVKSRENRRSDLIKPQNTGQLFVPKKGDVDELLEGGEFLTSDGQDNEYPSYYLKAIVPEAKKIRREK